MKRFPGAKVICAIPWAQLTTLHLLLLCGFAYIRRNVSIFQDKMFRQQTMLLYVSAMQMLLRPTPRPGHACGYIDDRRVAGLDDGIAGCGIIVPRKFYDVFRLIHIQ